MQILFYIFAGLAVLGALGVIILRNPIYCALSLVGSFFSLGAIYVLVNVEFIAVMQVLIYAGAIMVLFLFVLMLLNPLSRKAPTQWRISKVLGALLVVGLFFQLSGMFFSNISYGPSGEFTAEKVAEIGSIRLIGRLLYGEYVLHLEVVSILLLVAVIGSVIIAKKKLNPPSEGS